MTRPPYLVDTSVWILGLRRDGPAAVREWLRDALRKEAVVIAPVIMLELLVGAPSEERYRALREELRALPQLEIDGRVWDKASWMAFMLRRRGVTVPTMDTLIAALALVNGCLLVHRDHHYEMAREVFPELRTMPADGI
ncbi:MAG: PIN domain nuclease [Bacillota bacterium]|nr:PIN domain nuclease [Bacillota bacterium]